MYLETTAMRILLNDLRIYAYHGVLEQEKRIGGWFRVTVEAETPMEKSTLSDQLEDTVNYADMVFFIRDEMTIPSQLLEHVAGRIARRLLHSFPQLSSIKARVVKENPPISGLNCAGIGVEITLNRE